jgi:hypothetical protein
VLAFNIATQVNDGIISGVGNYGLIVGPAGSSTQLAMNTLYFADETLGTIPFSVISNLSQEMSVKKVIPFSMADSYNGYGVVGTTSEYLFGEYLPCMISRSSNCSGILISEFSVFPPANREIAKIVAISKDDNLFISFYFFINVRIYIELSIICANFDNYELLATFLL